MTEMAELRPDAIGRVIGQNGRWIADPNQTAMWRLAARTNRYED
jgi:hypothetical protein